MRIQLFHIRYFYRSNLFSSKQGFVGFLTFFVLLQGSVLFAQVMPVNSLQESNLRSMQLRGEIDSSISFTILPLTSNEKLPRAKISAIDSAYLASQNRTAKKGGMRFHLLPISLLQQFNSHHPYGWNDGAMIAAKGYQNILSAGLYASVGPLEIQLQPEMVYAANPHYENTKQYGPDISRSYSKLFAGQSSIRLSAGAVSLGVSTENLWWGPGRYSSLMMSNNAPGFGHIFFRTRKPVRTPIGSFEWQLIAGKLTDDTTLVYENQNLVYASFSKDWRYVNAVVISYNPRWVPGLFVGFARSLQQYSADLDIPPNDFVNKYLPVLSLGFQKKNVQNDDNRRTDQLGSFFLRWVFPKTQVEFYLEYGFNDYGVSIRDYVMAPTHAAAYLAGLKKIVALRQPSASLELGLEVTQMSESPDRMVRPAGNWYQHGAIFQGYTNKNQIMGAGAGLGCNVQTLSVNWVRGQKQMGFLFERVERDPLDYTYRWIDLSIGFMPQWQYKNMIFSGKLQFINSSQYAWEKDVNRFNLHSMFQVSYLL